MSEQNSLKCKQCGEYTLDPNKAVGGVVKCNICGFCLTLPRKEISPAALSFLRQGEHDLDACDFEKAYTAYQKAAELDKNEPEAYFGMALAKFKVQYLKDEVNNHLQPICHEISEKVFTEDKDYKKALELATLDQKKVYRAKGGEIDDIRDEFFALKKSGLDYNCFLCAKVTAEDGSRTAEYDWTSALYDELKDKGYSPFFSERKLKDETGSNYEAHILYALYTSECMLIVCSNEEYLHTKWVKNEYTRFLSMIANEEKERDAVTFVFRGNPIEKLPGRLGKLQGIDLANPNAYARIAEYVEKHTPAARARREEEARKKQEAEAARDRALEEMQEQLRQLREGNQPAETEQTAAEEAEHEQAVAEQTAAEEDARDRELKELKEQLKQLLEANQKAAAKQKAAEEEARKQEEARKAAEEEARKQEEARKAAEEEARKQEEARKAAEEARKQKEARKAAEEARKQKEARKAEEAERKRLELAQKPWFAPNYPTLDNYNKTDFAIEGTVLKEFKNKSFEGEVRIPRGVTVIGWGAFSDCKNLTGIVIPNVVTSIGNYAFSNCTSLASIIIPESVTSIGTGAFSYCCNLTSIFIPKSVTLIGTQAFWLCFSLEKLEVEAGNPAYHSSGNCLIETASKKLVAGCNSSVIPSDGSVTSIGEHAFSDCRNLTSIIIPKSVILIGYFAFSCCRMTSIVIPESVASIGPGAFSNCGNLKSIFIPQRVNSIGKLAFSNCANLTIYCEAKQEPDGWAKDWNPERRPVVWGAKKIQ